MITRLLLVVLLLLAAPARADDLDSALAILDRLEATPMTAAWEDVPLAVVVGEIIEKSQVPIRVDWESIRRMGVRPATPVSLHGRPTSALSVLSALMLALGDDFDRPVFEAYGGQLVVTSIDGTEPMRMTTVYDVRDLLADHDVVAALETERPPYDVAADPDADLDESGTDGKAGNETGDENDKPDTPASPPGPMTSRDLLMLVIDHVDPEAWVDFGGTRGKIGEHDGKLLVTVPATTHRRLRNALDLLRAGGSDAVSLDAAIVETPDDAVRRLSRRHPAGSRAFARALLRDPASAVLWQTLATTRPGRDWSVDSEAGDAAVRLEMRCVVDEETGVIEVEIVGRTLDDDAKREISATVAMPRRAGAAVLEFPAARTGEASRRFLVLTPKV